MLRAPIWTTSACVATASACWESSSSVTTGSPVSARASVRISNAAGPRPLNANGDVRGLKAPPRSIEAPAALTVRATSSVCSRDSTMHGPAIRQKVVPPPLPARPAHAPPREQTEGRPPPPDAPVDMEEGGFVVRDLRGRELVGPRDRPPPVDARHALEPELTDALGVADRADRGRQLAR